MKKTAVLFGFLGLFLFQVINIHAQPKFSLKIKGGYNRIFSDDLNSVTASHDRMLRDISSALGTDKDGLLEKMSGGLDLEGELMVQLTRTIAIGLGFACIKNRKASSSVLSRGSLFRLDTEMKLETSAYPIKLSCFCYFPLGSGLSLYLNGGIGYYFGRMTYSLDLDENILDFSSSSQASGAVEDKGSGYHAGLGFEMKIGKALAVFLDAGGRYIKLGNWQGKESSFYSGGNRESRSGTLWYYEAFDAEFQKYYSNLILGENRPELSGIKNVRKAEINLSGLSLKLGIRFFF